MNTHSKISLSNSRARSAPQVETRWRSRIMFPLLLIGLGGLALLPRVIGLDDFYTIDEASHWQRRVHLFLQAIRSHDWAGTNLTGHPGVTTMWLGSLGRWLALRAGLDEPGMAGGATYLAYLRLPLAVTNSLIVVLGYLLLRRLVRPSVALLAALLWATSPFLIAHSRLLHLDALVTSFMTLSLLLLLCATERPATVARGSDRGWLGWLIGAGVCAGLALLTKGPALVLLPTVGLLLATLAPRDGWRGWLSWVALRYSLWLLCAIVTFAALWPAMWVAPVAAVTAEISEVIGNGGQPHAWGNFFMGRAVADPGWLFYPAVVLLRTSPLTLLGLALSPLALRLLRQERRVLLALGGYALLFGLAVSIGAKKFDRYLLPIWPALEIIAAAGLMAAVAAVAALVQRRGWLLGRRALAARTASALLIGALVIGRNVSYHPYYLAYFNPLLGGGAIAQRMMLVGWGEGLEQIGAWLAQRPDLGNGPVLSWIPANLVPFVPQQVHDLDPQSMMQLSSYAVLYARSAQKEDSPPAAAYARQSPPLYTLTRYGIDYASVYQLPRPFSQAVDAVFGDGLHLRGFSLERSAGALTLSPSWNIQTAQAGGVFCFIHVIGPDGSRVAQVDLPLDDGLFKEWQAGQQFGRPITLPLPSDLAGGVYRLVLGVYQPSSGERLTVSGGAPAPETLDGPHVIQLSEWLEPQ
jgi:4-amino-4-deoxy-L-arabinose transferase-like glycosyltransferase